MCPIPRIEGADPLKNLGACVWMLLPGLKNSGHRGACGEGGSVIPFEKEFVEVGDEEAEQAPYSQDGLDGC